MSGSMTNLLNFCTQNRILILSFHDILTTADPLQPEAVDLQRFDLLLDWLEENFEVVDLGSALRSGIRNQKPRACITFDDGYPSWVNHVLPRLKSRRMHATFFVSTDSLQSGIHWHQRVLRLVRAIPDHDSGDLLAHIHNCPTIDTSTLRGRRKSIQLVQTWLKSFDPIERDIHLGAMETQYEAVGRERSLDNRGLTEIAAAGHAIGAHTKSHPILKRISTEQARKEILEPRDILFEKTRVPIEGFAYPNGKPGEDFDTQHVDIVRSGGYSFAVTTWSGIGSQNDDRYLLKRFTPWGRTAAACTRQTLGVAFRNFFSGR